MKIRGFTKKIFAYFLIVIVLSLSCVGIFSYIITSGELEEMVENQMDQIAGNAVHHTDLYLKDYERSIVSLLTNRQIMEFIDLPATREEYDYYLYRKTIREVSVDPLFIRNPKLASVYLISDKRNAVYYYNNVNEQSFNAEDIQKQRDYFLANTTADGQLSILNHTIIEGQENQMLTIVRRIRGYTSPELSGLLAIEMRSADLSALWKGIDLGKYGYLFIIDDKGRYIYHPDGFKVGTSVPKAFFAKLNQAGSHSFADAYEGDERMYVSRKSEFSDWQLVVSMPIRELRKPLSNIRSTTLVVGLFTLILAILLAYRFGKSIAKPVQTLKSGMRETEKGNWATIPLPPHRDEIVELMVRYNLMVKRLSEAVDRVVQVELSNSEIRMERQKAEFQSLQLQINPHFMYNTLETIVCYATIQDSEEISEIVKALAYMLRYSVQTNLEEITVANELKHVMYYLVVLRHRIGREFEIDVAIKPEYLLHVMVRLTLQPLVENVFQHAFPDGLEDYHVVRIDGGVRDGIFWISVEDNGTGMSEAKLTQLREKLNTNRLADGEVDEAGKKGGIGVLNVHRRIQMVYGEQYGLRIESKLEQGTKMIMAMPALPQKLE
ncbi:histidine kinase [Paenibacillus sp. CGMCC 1.16610]|uniref:HAMP domain-containing protein n=1 Tax=Paenibacillus anseongense TaxID=2682845 RepID=A0ABW9U7S4_9BACL|nr:MULTISPECIES: sensor histidine kinase [Paenibacillus]MBA2940299.1 histidine kinase [Paenibacillus sp. CGMCC 1.16610]MVQ35476.1 HAMP domain-containing protein [Paenibacillus anseongense]